MEQEVLVRDQAVRNQDLQREEVEQTPDPDAWALEGEGRLKQEEQIPDPAVQSPGPAEEVEQSPGLAAGTDCTQDSYSY